MQVKLKTSSTKLHLLPDLLLNYADKTAFEISDARLNFMSEEKEERYLIKLSIISELFEKLNSRTIKRYPAKQPTIKIELHEGIILYHALKHHEATTENDYTRSIASQLAGELHKQKPSISQINLKSILS